MVGAGAAGLAAAARLREAGATPILIEAGQRIGGRAHTVREAALGGAALDLGASWIHDAERNPLVAIAAAVGEALIEPPEMHRGRSFRRGEVADAAALSVYEDEETAWVAAAEAKLGGADISLAEAVAQRRGRPWAASVEAWEGAIIAAADAGALSLRDWHRNRLGGRNLRAQGGLGRFVADRLGPPAGPVRTGLAAYRIGWGEAGVRVHTAEGVIEAVAVIVTVSTGVLRSGRLAFDPPLPAGHLAALDALPQGLLSKVALRATGADRLGLPSSCTLDRDLAPGEPAMIFQAWPDGADHVIGFVGGEAARQLARAGHAAAFAFARDQLAAMLGGDARRAVAQTGVASDWADDPCFLGAYAYAKPGGAEARAQLAQPLAGARVVLAGEACRTDGLAGTVGGAVLSGRDAADCVIAGFQGRPARV